MLYLDCSNYEKFIKFCELNGYVLKEFQKELARSVLEGNNNYLILPRQNGRKYVMDTVKKFKGAD